MCDHHGVQRAAATSGTDAARPVRTDLGWSWFDTTLVVALAFATIFVHPFHLLLSRPYWFDESWVAVLTKAPLTKLPRVSSTTPIGFVVLLRLVPGSGLQRGRLVVLGFSALTASTAYVLTRGLGWEQRRTAQFAAAVVALAVMLMPVSLVRNDLKPYTCDGFCALLLLLLGLRAEQKKSRRSLFFFALGAAVAMPFSTTVLFMTVAVFAGLLASAALDRSWRRVVDILVVGLVAGVLLGGYFAAAVAPNVSSKVHTYWTNFYLAGSVSEVWSLVLNRFDLLSHYLAMPPPVFVGFFAAGIAMLVRLRARALAIALPLLWLEMGVLGRLERYPFLDLRTSQFVLVSSIFVVALGAVGVVLAVERLVSSLVPKPFAIAVAALLGGALAVSYAIGFVPYLRNLNIPGEDVRTETRAVAAHLRPGDILLINQSGNFGSSYYWPHAKVDFHRDDSGQHFATSIAGLDDALYVPTRYAPDVLAALRTAVARWQAAGPGSRLFILRSHVTNNEQKAWQAALLELRLTDREQVIKAGDPLLLFEKPPVGGS